NCVFELCGVTQFHRKMFGVVVTSSESQRHTWLTEVRQAVTRFFPETQAP
ncbi:MAG TPA: NAD(P)H dehydrogenase, partial [Syntrophobacteraceae bacterium]|nr:NAD(P)H dehydrogenase [Syntrophobacteraceae bacterium]